MNPIPEALTDLATSRFAAAKAAGSLIFSHTELTTIRTSSGIPFQLRYCPALSKKPQTRVDTSRPKKDPFANPEADLVVAELPQDSPNPTHFIILNKYPVIRDHLILATKAYKRQTDLLEQNDVALAYECLTTWEKAPVAAKTDSSGNGNLSRKLFAFFNSGDHSGASQPHRHIQFLPVENMADESRAQGWGVLIDSVASSPEALIEARNGFLSSPKLPFTHFVARLPPSQTPSQLHSTYLSLHSTAVSAIHAFTRSSGAGSESKDNLIATDLPPKSNSSIISYNLAMTTTAMAICPRASEGLVIRHGLDEGAGGPGDDDGSGGGSFVEMNGTLLAGTLMVKERWDWYVLKEDPARLDTLLKSIGVPPPKEKGPSKMAGHL